MFKKPVYNLFVQNLRCINKENGFFKTENQLRIRAESVVGNSL